MAVQKKPPRKNIPVDRETAVLINSGRRCVLCFHLNRDLEEKHGQIAHLDGDRTNRAEDNLAWMCLPHHSLFDSKTSQHKRSEEHTSELKSPCNLVCCLLLYKKKKKRQEKKHAESVSRQSQSLVNLHLR